MTDTVQKAELFKTYPVLSKVSRELVDKMISRSRLIALKAGAPVFAELQPCEVFPFILAGRIRVYKQSVNGRELSLYDVTPGDVCVVSAGCLLGNEAYTASGMVKQDSQVLMVDSSDFDDLLKERVFREFIFSLVSRRISGLMQLVEEVAFQKLDKRLASFLLRAGQIINISHQELADELGTVREIITRLLNTFTDTGVIRIGRGWIEVIDEAALKQILEDW